MRSARPRIRREGRRLPVTDAARPDPRVAANATTVRIAAPTMVVDNVDERFGLALVVGVADDAAEHDRDDDDFHDHEHPGDRDVADLVVIGPTSTAIAATARPCTARIRTMAVRLRRHNASTAATIMTPAARPRS